MYKLVAIDLDGTMLNSYGEVTENTKKIIDQTIKKGIEVVIASGRTSDSVKNIAKEIGCRNYFIAGNGSIIYDVKNKKNIYERYIPKEKAIDIVNICEENSISYSVYTNKTILASSLKYNVLYYYRDNLRKEQSKKTSITIVEDITKYLKQMKNEKVIKIMICDNTKSVFNSITRKLKNIENIDVLDVSHMSRKVFKNGSEEVPIEYYYTEITTEGVDKWYALEFLMDKLNINKKEVMTIGDNANDKKMIKNAGCGIAMGGSIDQLVKIADFVTDDNDHEGVANALKKINDI